MNKVFLFFILLLLSCNSATNKEKVKIVEHPNSRVDKSSFTELSKARIKHLSLSVQVDFDSSIIRGVAGYNIERNNETLIHFDIQDLDISKVFINDSSNYRKLSETTFRINKGNDLGDDLEIDINDYTSTVHIVYKTRASSKALEWLSKEQTLGKRAPFLYTNGFSNHTRSWIPIQDSPGIRITYQAVVKIPRYTIALMTADNPKVNNTLGTYEFFQKNPIPPYLIALAVGNLHYNQIGPKLGVYSESKILIKASDEFEDMGLMMQKASEMYGSYKWNRYDLLILPPSFPLGGMENPQLSFISPTLIAGDKSLSTVIAHELSHSWSGNLVSNATWNDFWLNEGFTVYLERRIMEELKGVEFVNFQNEIALKNLENSILHLDPNDTKLKLDIGKRNPDDAITAIAYEKGYFFLREIEKKVGRKEMDVFLNNYFTEFAFQSITTEDFLHFLRENFDEDYELNELIEQWVYSPGLPETFELEKSKNIEAIDTAISYWIENGKFEEGYSDEWSSDEWVYFIGNMPDEMNESQMNALNLQFQFSKANSDIRFEWFKLAIRTNYAGADEDIERFLLRMGRLKYVRGLYQALLDNSNGGKEKAQTIYTKARPMYHSFITAQFDDELLLKEVNSDSLAL